MTFKLNFNLLTQFQMVTPFLVFLAYIIHEHFCISPCLIILLKILIEFDPLVEFLVHSLDRFLNLLRAWLEVEFFNFMAVLFSLNIGIHFFQELKEPFVVFHITSINFFSECLHRIMVQIK